MRKIGKVLLVVLGIVLVLQALETAFMVWVFRSRHRRALRSVRRFNKLLNPLRLPFSGRRLSSTATVHHHGRRTGASYATPVLAQRSNGGFIVPLPYGTEVDWLRNLRAAGRGTLDFHGCTYVVDEPTVLNADEVISALPAMMARIVRLNRTRHVVRLRAAVARP